MTVLERVRAALVHPKAPLGLGFLAFLVSAPALGAGFIVDDHIHRYFSRGGNIPGGPRGPWDLYRFADGGPGLADAMTSGLHPWWTSPELRLAFFRPVASLLRVAEEKAFGDHAVLDHLVTSVVFVATVMAVHAAFRRWIGGAAAMLGALLFAVDDAHATTVTWIAARHSLLATGFGALALALYLRGRDEKKVSIGAGLAMMAALASSEASLSFLPMFLAIALVEDPRSTKDKSLALAPIAASVVVWLGIYAAFGYGSRGSGYYVDPVRDPVRFVGSAITRLPALAGAQLFFPPSELSSMAAPLAAPLAVFGFVVLVVAFVAAYRCAERRRAVALFGAFVLGLVPACGTNSDDRLLMVPGIAAMGLVAVVCRSVYASRDRFASKAVFGAVAFVHVVMAFVLSPVRMSFFSSSMTNFVGHGAATLYTFDRPLEKDLLLVTTPDGLLPTSMHVSRQNAGLPVARSARILVTGPAGEVSLTRVSDSSFEVAATGGMMRDPFVAAVRAKPFRAGDSVTFPALTVLVKEATVDGVPSKLLFTFAESLDRPDLVTMRWHGPRNGERSGYEPFVLPPPGASVKLDAIDFATVLAEK